MISFMMTVDYIMESELADLIKQIMFKIVLIFYLQLLNSSRIYAF
jgi:hypothetical protein